MFFRKDKYIKATDEELMAFICLGETEAFDILYSRYGRKLMAYFMRMLNYNKEVSEDAVQDIFLKIAADPEKYNGSRPFKTWIFSIASNYCKNIYRHADVKQKYQSSSVYYEMMRSPEESGSDKKLDNHVFSACLHEVLEELSPDRKEAFILRYQEEKTIPEIAQIQDCPEGSVKSKLHYTVKILEQKMKHYRHLIHQS